MSIYVKDPATSQAVRKLAKLRGVTLTEAIRLAVDQALREDDEQERWEKLNELVKRVSSRPDTGFKADKAFYDSLYED